MLSACVATCNWGWSDGYADAGYLPYGESVRVLVRDWPSTGEYRLFSRGRCWRKPWRDGAAQRPPLTERCEAQARCTWLMP